MCIWQVRENIEEKWNAGELKPLQKSSIIDHSVGQVKEHYYYTNWPFMSKKIHSTCN